MLSKTGPGGSSTYSPSMKWEALGCARIVLFPAWIAFGLFEIVEVHVVAHVALGGLLQRLVIPGVIGAVAQRLVDDPAPRLAFAHGGVKGFHVPAGIAHFLEGAQRRRMRRGAGEVGEFQRIGVEVEELVGIEFAVDIFPLAFANADER